MGCVEAGFIRFDWFSNHMKTILLCLMTITIAAGCKKAQPSESAPGPAPENASTAPTTPATGNSSAPANQPAQAQAAPTIDATKAFADVNTALKARDYQKATETLLALQRQKQLTDQQSMAVRGQMVQLQSAVAAGVASGDPNAKAAADRLRAEASGN